MVGVQSGGVARVTEVRGGEKGRRKGIQCIKEAAGAVEEGIIVVAVVREAGELSGVGM